MLAGDLRPEERQNLERPAGGRRVESPKASAQKLHQRNEPVAQKQRTPDPAKDQGFQFSAVFAGASPVASALGTPVGRDPSRKIEVVSSQQRLGRRIQQERLVDGGFVALRG